MNSLKLLLKEAEDSFYAIFLTVGKIKYTGTEETRIEVKAPFRLKDIWKLVKPLLEKFYHQGVKDERKKLRTMVIRQRGIGQNLGYGEWVDYISRPRLLKLLEEGK